MALLPSGTKFQRRMRTRSFSRLVARPPRRGTVNLVLVVFPLEVSPWIGTKYGFHVFHDKKIGSDRKWLITVSSSMFDTYIYTYVYIYIKIYIYMCVCVYRHQCVLSVYLHAVSYISDMLIHVYLGTYWYLKLHVRLSLAMWWFVMSCQAWNLVGLVTSLKRTTLWTVEFTNLRLRSTTYQWCFVLLAIIGTCMPYAL